MTRRALPLLALLLLGATLLLSRGAGDGPVYTRMEAVLHDWRIGMLPPASRPAAQTAVIAIDEASLRAEGAWPWPRGRLAELLERLVRDYGVAAVGLDVLLPEPGGDPAGDARLARAVALPGVVLAQAFAFSGEDPPRSGSLAAAPPGTRAPRARLPAATGYVANHAQLARAGRGAHITPRVDTDGAVRQLPPLICHAGQCYDVLGMALLRRLMGTDHIALRPGRGPLAAAYYADVGGAQRGVAVPLDANLRAYLPFSRDAGSLRYISASEVLAGEAPADLLRGRPVFVGATAVGLADAVPTPREGLSPGVALHAQWLLAVLEGEVPVTPRHSGLILLGANLALTLLALGLYRYAGPLAAPAGVLAAAGVWLLGNGLLWHQARLALPPAEPLLLAALLVTGLTPARLFGVERQWRRLHRQFSAYLPAPVIRQLVETGADPAALEAERREITVMFADIRGFTPLSESRSPEALAALMQRTLTDFTRVIHRFEGTLDKYIGDAIMAFWGAPLAQPEHRAQAFAAAQALHQAAGELTAQLRAEGEAITIRLGIGLHSGEATVGNLGSELRRAYTALGDTVNVAARIQALSNSRDEPLLLSAATRSGLGDVPLRCLGEQPIRGRREPVTLYALAAPPAAGQ